MSSLYDPHNPAYLSYREAFLSKNDIGKGLCNSCLRGLRVELMVISETHPSKCNSSRHMHC